MLNLVYQRPCRADVPLCVQATQGTFSTLIFQIIVYYTLDFQLYDAILMFFNFDQHTLIV